jgi:hypothetical protein
MKTETIERIAKAMFNSLKITISGIIDEKEVFDQIFLDMSTNRFTSIPAELAKLQKEVVAREAHLLDWEAMHQNIYPDPQEF